MKKHIHLLLVVLIAFASCKKDKNDEITKENLAGSYKLTASTSQAGNGPIINEYALLPVCEKDDLFKLNGDLSYNYVDAGTKCNPAGDDNGSWSLPSTTQIILDGQSLSINSFDGKTLVLSVSIAFNGTTNVSTITLMK